MKKFMKKSVSLLMAGAMVIMPITMSAQAKEIDNNTNEINASTYSTIPSGYTIKATITGDNVNIRNYSGVSLGHLNKSEGDVIYLKSTAVTVINGIPSRYGYSPKHKCYGYVSISYMKY
ncbi:MAG: hypothetical protein HDT39_07625 [Lachnospiraceae bacterium]|nr:hypothetical protein [Lachnospiraceae bacterium]